MLDGESMRDLIFIMIDATAERIVNTNIEEERSRTSDMHLLTKLMQVFGSVAGLKEQLAANTPKMICGDMIQLGRQLYENKEKNFRWKNTREVERCSAPRDRPSLDDSY